MKLYEIVLAEAKPFLGNQAEPFIRRQCKSHLNMAFEDLTTNDLTSLAWWIRISASLVIPVERAETLATKIMALEV